MKTNLLRKLAAVAVGAGLALSSSMALAQNSPSTTAGQPATVNAAAPQLPYGATQILQLTQAKVGDDTIIAYVKNSGNSYGLNSDQIIYLKQQGVSDTVITAMLNQPRPGVVAYTPPAPAPQPAVAPASPQPDTTATVAPTVTYVQPAPVTTYYYNQPYYQPYYYPAYYPSYAWFPPVSLSFAWGSGWHGGGYGGWHGGGNYGGWHGGGYGGWHGGGGWHH